MTNDSGVPTPVMGSSSPPIVFSVAIFAPVATGNAAPLGTISGEHTGLVAPRTVAVDSAGRIYVAGEAPEINVFAAGSEGDVAPIETIAGSNTGLDSPDGIAFDSSGNVYVSDAGDGKIFDFGPFQPGRQNVAPIGAIGGPAAVFESGPSCLTIFGGLIYACEGAVNSSPAMVEAFALGTFGPNVGPVSTFESPDFSILNGIAFDPSGNAYVETGVGNVLDVFRGVTGASNANVIPSESYAAGRSGGSGPALDAVGNAYVATQLPDAVNVYPPFAAGAAGVAPIRSIAGPKTGLDRPYGIAIH